MVIDADAVRALSANPKLLHGKQTIITPHSNEFKELTGVELSTKVEERAKHVKEWAHKLGTTIILKGHVDIISDGKSVAMNKTGNPNMTKGGFGDMLTGVCGALIARRKNKVDLYEAACAAAYINGKAGDLAAKEKGIGLLPTDAIEKIPEVIQSG
jgi:NAD(P)H-hydrate epimerase